MVNIVSLLEGDPTSQSEKGTIYKEISKPREEDSASLVDELAVNTQNEEVRDNHETPMIRTNNPSQGRGGCSWSWKLEAKRTGEKKSFWTLMKEIVIDLNRPWMMFGELNEIMDSFETFVGQKIWKMKLFLKNFAQEVAGINLRFIGGRFTWDNCQCGQGLIEKKLDRAIEIFDFTNRKILDLEAELKKLQQKDTRDFAKKSIILDQLRVQQERWESIPRQKSRKFWLKEGDRNSKFFHSTLLIKRRKNSINAIKEEQDWIYDLDQIGQYFLKHFKDIYKSDFPLILEGFKELGWNYISREDNLELIKILTVEEIKDVI
nr:uncharacterized protein LOC125423181 [Ziziphus jujuba var. spinosa]